MHPVILALIIFLSVVVGIYLFLRLFIIIVSKRPKNIGLQNGWLAPCPAPNNCVSTYESDEIHHIDPIPIDDQIDVVYNRVISVLNAMPRTRIIRKESQYIYIEFRSLMWGFIDDVEIYVDLEKQVLQMRSASRIGTNDYGMNRKRMEEFRSRFIQSKK